MEERVDAGGREKPLREQPILGIDRRGEAWVVRLGGELDLYNAPAVGETLRDVVVNEPERLVLDLAEVEFIDSTALGTLIEVRAGLPTRGALLLAAPGIDVRRTLKVSGIDRHLPVHDTVDAALAATL